jgi:hypothetical protein
MVNIGLTPDLLIVRIEGANRFWSLKRQLKIPLTHVVSVETDHQVAQQWHKLWKGFRWPGTYLPGIITAGTFYKGGERIFWDVRHPERAITIHLTGEKYSRLLLEVDDPAADVAAIRRALSLRKAA